MNTKTNTKLILSTSHNAKSFADNENEFLQKNAFLKVCKLIKDSLVIKKIISPSDDTNFYETRGHYSILVNGKRGSGKTTFALTAIKLLEVGKQAKQSKIDQKDQIVIEKGDIEKGDIVNLGILDPTLIDSKEHVLLAVITKIKEKVEHHFKNEFDTTRDNSSMFSKHIHPLDDWREALRKLAQGLQQLDGVGKDSMQDSIWEDPVTIMEEGLQSIKAGLELNKRLHYFIDKSLELLKAKAFILVLDDIDTFFEKGWPVLESLRKYLTTPKLVTLVCGDLQLYQAQVQRQQWLQLGDLATKFESDTKNRKNHEAMIHALTEQYLLKVLPANRRVELDVVADLGDSVDVYQDEAAQQAQQTGSSIKLKDHINDLIKESYLLAPETPEGRLFYNFLARRPLRMAIQMLQSLEDNQSRTGYQLPVRALQNIFADWVYQQGASKLLQKSDSNPLLIQQLLDVLHSSGLMQDNLELLPRYSDDSLNAGTAVASRLLCDYFEKNPGKALDYMVRSGLARQAVYFTGSLDKRPSEEDIMRALSVTTSDDLLTVTRQWSPVVVHGLSNASTKSIHLGTMQILSEGTFFRNRSQKALKSLYRTTDPRLVRTYAEAENKNQLLSNYSSSTPLAKGINFLYEYYNNRDIKENSQHYAISPVELQKILQNINQPELSQISGLLFAVVTQGNSNYTRASSLNLLGFLDKLLSLVEEEKEDGSATLEELIKSELKRAGQIRTYPVPVDFSLLDEKGITVDKDKEEDEGDDEDGNAPDRTSENNNQINDSEAESTEYNNLVNQLAEWLRQWNNQKVAGLDYPPHVWSRIWQRFYYTLEQQDKAYKPSQRFLGIIIHRQIIGFLNAVLVEELRQKKDIGKDSSFYSGIGLDNPVLADDIYINNLKKFESQQKSIERSPLHHHLAICPLWSPFLENSLWPGIFRIEPQFYLNENQIKLMDLLNLVAPTRDSENATPSLWTHEEIQEKVLKNDTVKTVIKTMIKDVETKELKNFVRTHFSRTNNDTTVDSLKKIQAELQ